MSDTTHRKMETHFAPAERLGGSELLSMIERVTSSPILSTAMEALGSWVAVLNKHRQVLSVNHAFLETLGVKDPSTILGLRPGEVLQCIHADDNEGGCGTGRFCRTCGAVIAIVATLDKGEPQQQECVLTREVGEKTVDHVFSVRCTPFNIDGESLLMISLKDISAEKRRMALERTFLHDLSNVLMGLSVASEELRENPGLVDPHLLAQIQVASETLDREVNVQRLLCHENPEKSRLHIESVQLGDILKRVWQVFAGHPIAKGKTVDIEWPESECVLETDLGLLCRVLINMVINGLEAGEDGDVVRVSTEADAVAVTFCVWNKQHIPVDTAMRVFQKYYSTKGSMGRGLGTYGMKLLGEKLLGGRVSFTSSPDEGTTFRLWHPYVITDQSGR